MSPDPGTGHASLVPGVVIDGKYRLERMLGKGGMGIVFAAEHIALGDRVALKFLHDEADHPTLEERFVREARAMFRMKSQHVAKVHDIGHHGKLRFIVLEFLEGETLEHRLERLGPIGVDEAIGFMLQICEGIAEAHALGVIHRDIKPENIFVTASPTRGELVKVLDFGIAKLRTPSHELTGNFATIGTLQYMAPEQARRAENADERCDIWGLGAVLFRMLTNRLHFDLTTHADLVRALTLEHPVLDPCALAPIPRDVGDIALRCLQHDPARRFQNVAELVDVLSARATPRVPIPPRRVSQPPGALADGPVSGVPVTPRMNVDVAPPPPLPTAIAFGMESTIAASRTLLSSGSEPAPEPRAPHRAPPTTVPSDAARTGTTVMIVAIVAMTALMALVALVVIARREAGPRTESATDPAMDPAPPPAASSALAPVIAESAAPPIPPASAASAAAPENAPRPTKPTAASGTKRAPPRGTASSLTPTLY